MSKDVLAPKNILVIVDAPDLLPEAHLDSCERMADFVPVIHPRLNAQCSGYVADIDEVSQRFPSVLWCECMDNVVSRGVPYATESIATLTDGMERLETLSSGGTSVDVYYQWELESYLFAVDGRVGARLSFDAIRDEVARAEIFAECATRAINAIRWADQNWQNRKPRATS